LYHCQCWVYRPSFIGEIKCYPKISKKTNQLFDLEDKIMLYDLTNTYFEGTKRKSALAKFGRSKE
jgi:hypothetical protein